MTSRPWQRSAGSPVVVEHRQYNHVSKTAERQSERPRMRRDTSNPRWAGRAPAAAARSRSGRMRLRLRLVAVQVDVMYETYREESTRHEERTHPYRLFHAFDTILGRCDHLACHLDQLIRTGDKVRNLVDRRAHTRNKQARSTIEPRRLGRAKMQHAPVARQQHGLAWPGMAWHGVALRGIAPMR